MKADKLTDEEVREFCKKTLDNYRLCGEGLYNKANDIGIELLEQRARNKKLEEFVDYVAIRDLKKCLNCQHNVSEAKQLSKERG